jgi:hypothetical protein
VNIVNVWGILPCKHKENCLILGPGCPEEDIHPLGQICGPVVWANSLLTPDFYDEIL